MKFYKLCYRYLKKYFLWTFLYLLVSIFASIISIISPYISGSFIDSLIESPDILKIKNYCLVYAAINLCKILFDILSALFNQKVLLRMGYDFNKDIIAHIQKLPIDYMTNKDAVSESQLINMDTSNLIGFCISSIHGVLINSFLLITTFIVMLNINKVACAMIMIFIGGYAVLFFFIRKPLHSANKVLTKERADFAARLFEQLKFIGLIKTNSLITQFHQRLDKAQKSFLKAAINSIKINYIFQSLDNIIMVIMQISLYVIGGIQIINNNFTIGLFTVFMMYFGIMLSSTQYFFNFGRSYQNTCVSYDRIKGILANNTPMNGKKVLSKINKIEIDNLNFKYKDSDKNIFESTKVVLQQGNLYGLIGTNGSGKTTFINILLGLHEVPKKVIKYNDINYTELDMDNLRSTKISVIQQEPILINDTIMYNIFFSEDSEDKINTMKFKEISNILNISSYIENLELGYYTVINDNNDNLSGGERQKISLLRAFLKDADVIILDEPTSALDSATTQHVIDYLLQLKSDKIIIIITHNIDIINKVDIKLQVDNNAKSISIVS